MKTVTLLTAMCMSAAHGVVRNNSSPLGNYTSKDVLFRAKSIAHSICKDNGDDPEEPLQINVDAQGRMEVR